MSGATKRVIVRQALRIKRSFTDCAKMIDLIVYSGSLK